MSRSLLQPRSGNCQRLVSRSSAAPPHRTARPTGLHHLTAQRPFLGEQWATLATAQCGIRQHLIPVSSRSGSIFHQRRPTPPSGLSSGFPLEQSLARTSQRFHTHNFPKYHHQHHHHFLARRWFADHASAGSKAPSVDTRPKRPNDDARPPTAERPPDSMTYSMSKYLHLPNLPHRPSKEELLAAANGFWQRLKVRFKWASIRSMRPWNADEWGAFVSWFMLGHIVWILVGTTTFMSLVIFSINTVFAQETLAKWIGDYLTQSAGVTVVFESAIVPKWKDGVISFRNVFVSRRPGQVKSSVSKGSSTNAAAVAAAEWRSDQDGEAAEVDDDNYTQFDLSVGDVNVTLSLIKWWNGKGLLEDVEVKGVRGVIDRTSVRWPSEPVDPTAYRHKHQPGDFEIDSFKLEDLLVTVYQPNGFRPFSVSIYSAELPQLRKRWMFYDLLSAHHMSGSFDGSLFTIHPHQVHNPTLEGASSQHHHTTFKKFSRLRIDGLKIDHLNRGVEGPFGWIFEGNADIVADVMFPADVDDSIAKVVSEAYDHLEEMVIANRARLLDYTSGESALPTFSRLREAATEPGTVASPPALPVTTANAPLVAVPGNGKLGEGITGDGDDRRYLVMDLRMHLNDVRAAVPILSRQLLVRPIVAYINAKKTYIPISCRLVKRVGDFDGSWTIYDCGLIRDISMGAYDAFGKDVQDQQSRVRRLKKVGLWTLSVALQAVFMGMAGQTL